MKTDLIDILVPVDFEECSLRASEYAVQLAKETGGKIHFLYVIRKLDYFSELMRSAADIEKISVLVREKLKELSEKFSKEHNVASEYSVVHGKVHEETLKKAREINSAFIVIGDNSQSSEKSAGSNLSAIVAGAPCPVLVSKFPVRHVFNKIVVPLDLSLETKRQVRNAIVLAKKYEASLHLVSALIAGMRKKKSRIFQKMEEIQKTLADNNIECTSKLYPKSEIPPYKSVLEFAYEVQADSIVILTHQEKRGDNYIGAFAQNLIIESKIPVLSITAIAGDNENAETIGKFLDPFGIISGNEKPDNEE